MDNTDDTFIAGGMSPSFSGFSDDEEKTFIEGSSPRGADGVSRYQIESEIGRGGTGLVYLATDTRFNRKVALKRITGDQFTPGTSGPRQNITMFMTEVKALASLQHANIVHVYDVGMDGDGMYMVMEYLDGGSLKDRVLQSGPLNPEETARMGIQLCDALSMVHENGIVHRDIKPGNVLMTKRGMPKLADFDLVLDTASNREVAGAFLGTLHYMSPEQRVDSGQVDFRSDLFSLGATLYFAATGSVPEKIDPDKLHESLRSVIQKALQENLLFRFASALDMKKAFEEVLKTQIAEQAPGGHGAGTFPCYACSKLIPNGAVYCPECGKDLIEARKGIEKQVTEALGTVDGLVSKDMYREARDLLKDIQEKVKHPHFVYFKRRIDEKTVWVEKEEKKYQDREAELTQELHKAQEALAALNLEKASEIAQGIVKEERRFDALARKAREVIHKCEEIVGRRRQFEKDTAEASRLADTKAFDKALGLLSSILNESNPAYAEQREASAHLRDTLLARVKRLEEGLKARLAEAQAALDADRLDDAFHQATELVTEASHITYQDTFKNITDQSRELVKACHNQVAQYLENAQERSNNKVFDEAYVLLDKVLNLSAGAFSGDREKAAEAKIRFRWQELEHHMAVAAESVSQKNFEEAFRLLNLVLEEKSKTYEELKAKATAALILAKRKRRWRKIRMPLVLGVLAIGGVFFAYYDYLPHPPNVGVSAQDIQAPKHSVGTVYVMESINHSNPNLSYTAERTIRSVGPNRISLTMRNINSNYLRNLEYDSQWNLISISGASGEGSDYSPPIKYYDFPLKQGKRWKCVSTERNIKTGKLREHTIEAEVGDWERVSVPAGKFRAIKVTIKSQLKDLQTGQITYGTDTSWYVPEVKRSVKSLLTSSNRPEGEKARQTIELIRYAIR
jgi:serine/threonine protein kinase